jgi:hypothetical protein
MAHHFAKPSFAGKCVPKLSLETIGNERKNPKPKTENRKPPYSQWRPSHKALRDKKL